MKDNRIIYNSNCENCQYGDSCPDARADKHKCKFHDPVNEELYIEELMTYLRSHIKPSIHKRLSRNARRSQDTFDDGVTPLDDYYVGMINDTLKEIRSGITGYLYSESQIAELMRFEPDINVTLEDGIFYVSL